MEAQEDRAADGRSPTDQVLPDNAGENKPYTLEEHDSQSAGLEHQQSPMLSDQEWKAGRKEWMIIIVISTVSLMVALDATILVTALPVSVFFP